VLSAIAIRLEKVNDRFTFRRQSIATLTSAALVVVEGFCVVVVGAVGGRGAFVARGGGGARSTQHLIDGSEQDTLSNTCKRSRDNELRRGRR
jgi:hypothetical protein